MKTNAIIVDIDWTVADHSHRLHHIIGKVKDWPRYNALAWDDTPILPVIELLNALRTAWQQYEVCFITWRTEEIRQVTEEWIAKHCPYIWSRTLYMRETWDHREDTVIKKEIYDNKVSQNYLVQYIFEDRPRVCKMRRDLWLYVFNCDQSWKFF